MSFRMYIDPEHVSCAVDGSFAVVLNILSKTNVI
jgi:hypothetical protein